MNRLSRILLLVSALAAASACVACRSGTTKLSNADAAAIRSATQRYVELDEARDPALLQIVGEDAIYMPPTIAPLEGRKAIEGLFKAHPWDHLSESLAEVDGRGDLAFARGSWSVRFKGQPVSGSYIEVWQKRPDGTWQIIRKVWNTE